METPSLAGKCPETLPDFALKREHVPRVLSTSRNMPGKTAPHLARESSIPCAFELTVLMVLSANELCYNWMGHTLTFLEGEKKDEQ